MFLCIHCLCNVIHADVLLMALASGWNRSAVSLSSYVSVCLHCNVSKLVLTSSQNLTICE